MKQIPFADTGA